MEPTPPELSDDLLEEILLRLPPDDPACLLRASVVCKTWGGDVSSPHFRRRLHDLHGTPPVLGFLYNWDEQDWPCFIPTTSSSFSLAAPVRGCWQAIDCRHGRALFLSGQRTELLVWEPITGAHWRIPVPARAFPTYPNVAVLCAADECNHINCHGGPFRLALIYVNPDGVDEYVTSACLYSSETGAWGELISMDGNFDCCFCFSCLVGKSLVYFMSDDGIILEYDLARHSLTLLHPPDSKFCYERDRFNLMPTEDGRLGLSQVVHPYLKLWSRKASDDTDAQWILSRVIYLENLLPNDAFTNAPDSLRVLSVVGFAEGANVIFVDSVVGLFTIELQSQRVRKVYDGYSDYNLIPVVSFYTPVPFGTHQDSPTASRYGKVAPAGCALLPKAQDVNDPSTDVYKSAQKEE